MTIGEYRAALELCARSFELVASAVHHERYRVAEAVARSAARTIRALVGADDKRPQANPRAEVRD